MRSGVIGTSRSRTPVASATALAIAGATPIRPGSPIALAPKGPDRSGCSTIMGLIATGTSIADGTLAG